MGHEVTSGEGQSSVGYATCSRESPNSASSIGGNDWPAQKPRTAQLVDKQIPVANEGIDVDNCFSTDGENSGNFIMGKADEQGQGQPQVFNAVRNLQMPYLPSSFQSNQMIGTNLPMPTAQLSTPAAQAQLAQQQLSYQQNHQQAMQQLEQPLGMFWANQYQEVVATIDFKNHSLPLARIKKIMKADEDVRMIAAEAPVLFARACEMFILELTYRSWAHTEENKRRTLQKNDIAGAIIRTDVFDFLMDIIPREEVKEVCVSTMPGAGGPNDSFPFYYLPPQMAPFGMMLTTPDIDQSMLYAPQSHTDMPQKFWNEHQQTVQQQPEHQQQHSGDP